MPKRRSVRRVDASSVQGDGAWVELRYLRWDEFREAKNWGEDSDDLDRKILVEHVTAWNWGDDDGEPLPQPGDDGEWLGQLTTDEVSFLIESVFGAHDPKN